MWSIIGRLVLSFLLSVAAALLNRPPEQESAERETPDFPRVTEGDKLGKVFGTVNVENPQVAWWGDVRVNPIVEKGPRRYGIAGPRSRTTVGYRYRVGMHLILSLGPVDRLKAIFSGEKRAFLGNVGNETIRINRENLHGGERRGGGIRGNFTVALGGPDQQPSPYLEARSQLDNPQPAYRGVTALIAEQPYVGTQATPQRFSARLERIRSVDPDYNNGEQWYPDKAPIFQRTVNEPLSVMISLDVSGSMDGQRIETAKGAITGYLENLRSVASEERVDIRIVAWSAEAQNTTTSRRVDNSDIDSLISFVDSLSVGGGTNFAAAFDGAESFFESSSSSSQFLLYFITDGLPVPASTADDAEVIAGELDSLGVNIYGINIELSDTSETERVDNTPWDGVPVVRADQDGPLSDSLVGPVAEFDLNPAHIIREVLISPDTGGSGDSSRINDESFEAAADRLYDEAFGLSLLWDGDQSRGDFISLVENHIDARVSQNRRTGLWEIDLIRNDYDEEELFEVDRGNVIEWTNVNRPENHTLQNQVIVKYNKPEVGEQGSITATNGASLRFMDPPMIILEERTYEGIQKSSLASRVAARDLLAVSSPLLRATATMTWLPTELNRGSPVILNDQKVGIDNVIARITEIRDGDGRDNSIEVDFVEDRFSIGTEGEIAIGEFRPPVIIAEPGDPRLVEEAPYWALGEETGFSQINETLSDEPDFGILHVAFGNPNGHVIDGDVRFDDGDGFEDGGVVDALPTFTLLSRMSRIASQTTVIVETQDSVEDIPPNTLAIIDNEIVEIQSIEEGGSWDESSYWRPVKEPQGQVFTLELTRGCLDTVPDWHHAQDKILPWGISSLISDDFSSGDSVDVKILTSTSREQLSEGEAPTDTVIFNSRAISPYPVGSVQSNRTFISPNYDPNEDYLVTWSHRNRLNQRDEVVGHVVGENVLLDSSRVPDGYEISNDNKTVVNVTGGSDYRRWVPVNRVIEAGDETIYYWEINVQATQTGDLNGYVGVFPAGLVDDPDIGYESDVNPINADGGIGYRGNGVIWADGTQRVTGLSSYSDGDIIMLAFRGSDGSFWAGLNGTWEGDPSTDPAPYQTPNLSGSGWVPYVQGRDEGDGHTIVTDVLSLTYSVPEGAEPFVDLVEPEDGTSYTVNVDALNAQGQVSENIESQLVDQDTSYLVEQPTAPLGSVAVRVQIEAERDGYTDYQSGVIYLIDPTDPETVALQGAYFDAAEIGSMFQDEEGQMPVTQDGDSVNRWNSLKGDLL